MKRILQPVMVHRAGALLLCAALLFSSCGGRRLARRERKAAALYATLRESLKEGEITLMRDSVRVLFPKNIMFDFNRAEVKPELNLPLQHFASILKQYHKTHILIIGRTDSVGDDTNNLQLSARRADSARTVLNYYGVNNKRLEHWGVGAKDPIATNATEIGRARNRCVEFIILSKKK